MHTSDKAYVPNEFEFRHETVQQFSSLGIFSFLFFMRVAASVCMLIAAIFSNNYIIMRRKGNIMIVLLKWYNLHDNMQMM